MSKKRPLFIKAKEATSHVTKRLEATKYVSLKFIACNVICIYVCTFKLLCACGSFPSVFVYRKAHRKATESQKKHQKEVEQLEQELMEVQQAMDQFEQEADSQGDDVQLMDSQVRVICS